MKKQIAGILIILGVGLFAWAQGTRDHFDAKKSEEELEIMRGILRTTISYVEEKSQKQDSAWRYANLRAMYLTNQGVVFFIPFSGMTIANLSEQAEELRDYVQANQETLRLARELSSRARNAAGKTTGAEPPAPPVPPVRPAPPAPPVPPAAPQINREELRKKVDDFRDQAKQRHEAAEANRAKMLQNLAEVKVHLIEAMANYGDSLTTVKPNEFINLVLETNEDNGDMIWGQRGQERHQDIISVQKSWITDYKAGKLNLDGFKQKVLQYSE